MAMEIQPAFDMSSIPRASALDPTLPDVTPIKPQSLETYNLIQIQLSAPAVPSTYRESAYQWLIEVIRRINRLWEKTWTLWRYQIDRR